MNQRSEVLSEVFNYQGSTALGYPTQQEDEFNRLTYPVPINYYLDIKAANEEGENWDLVMYSQEFILLWSDLFSALNNTRWLPK